MTELPENDMAMTGDADWENRRLCSDESCTGTIGTDGRCRICGRMCEDIPINDAGQLPSEDLKAENSQENLAEPPADSNISDSDADWENRRLCSDDACIGSIGPDGRCNVCGLPG